MTKKPVKRWVLYEIHLSTKKGPFMTMMWATSQKKALKDALKKLFKTRGIPGLWLDEKEFDNSVRLINYVQKNNKMDQVCKPCADQSLMSGQSSSPTDQ